MWLFLVTEIMLFGVFFAGYGLFMYLYPEMYREAHEHLNKVLGAVNTVVLLVSSLTMALAIAFIQRDQKNKSMAMLAVTFLCACAFLCIKYVEYKAKWDHGLLPGMFFHPVAEYHFNTPNAALFYSFYFVMTGLHAIHVIIGIIVLSWLLWRAGKGHFGSYYWQPLELGGLYWHIVDLIWIFLFPLFYLAG
jgi:cytochrome c oxidase subunit 3